MKKIIAFILIIIAYALCSCNCKSIDYNCFFDKTVEIKCETAFGDYSATGFFINADGLILTNKHVVKDIDNNDVITVRINDGIIKEAKILDISNDYDLAIIKVEIKSNYFSYSDEFNVGDRVFSLGNPKGYGLTLYEGIISSNLKNIIYNDSSTLSLQTNIEIYDGCSGGPLFNENGEVLGIMTFRIKDKGQNIPGISYAIPSKVIEDYLKGYKEKNK